MLVQNSNPRLLAKFRIYVFSLVIAHYWSCIFNFLDVARGLVQLHLGSPRNVEHQMKVDEKRRLVSDNCASKQAAFINTNTRMFRRYYTKLVLARIGSAFFERCIKRSGKHRRWICNSTHWMDPLFSNCQNIVFKSKMTM